MRALTIVAVALSLCASAACSDDPEPTSTAELVADASTGAGVRSDSDAGEGEGGLDAGPEADASGHTDAATDAAIDTDADADTDAGIDSDAASPPDCVPRRDAWEATTKAHVETSCAECHGATPAYGAPFSLTDYDAMVAGADGARLVDRMLTKLLDHTMPPPASPQPDHVALDTMIEWASCGQEHSDHTFGLVASRPVHQAPANPPAGTDTFDVTADEWSVGPNVIDDYRCFTIDMPITESRLMRRIDPIIDDGRVLHHLLVAIDRSNSVQGNGFSCNGTPPGEDLVYAWGPSLGALQFPEGGIRLEPGDRFVLQIHYNNGAGVPGVLDSSGFRVHHEAVGAKQWEMSEAGALNINIPPHQSASAQGICTVGQDVELFAAWPHMHEIGSSFRQYVRRAAGGPDETIVELTGWSFEAQLLYDTPMFLYQGDRIITECTWTNPTDQTVRYGTGTADEMCFGFLYTTADICSEGGL